MLTIHITRDLGESFSITMWLPSRCSILKCRVSILQSILLLFFWILKAKEPLQHACLYFKWKYLWNCSVYFMIAKILLLLGFGQFCTAETVYGSVSVPLDEMIWPWKLTRSGRDNIHLFKEIHCRFDLCFVNVFQFTVQRNVVLQVFSKCWSFW